MAGWLVISRLDNKKWPTKRHVFVHWLVQWWYGNTWVLYCLEQTCLTIQSSTNDFDCQKLGPYYTKIVAISFCGTLCTVIKKASTRLYFLKQLKRSGLSNTHLLYFYITVITPVLELCATSYNPALDCPPEMLCFTDQYAECHIYRCCFMHIWILWLLVEKICLVVFSDIMDPASCLHCLISLASSTVITSRLRSSETFPKVYMYTHTKRYCSFIQYVPNHYQ